MFKVYAYVAKDFEQFRTCVDFKALRDHDYTEQ